METHIVIVDDDPFMGKMLSFVLADGGYRTTILTDPHKVSAFLRDNPVDLVLSEVTLPHIDGLTLCTTLRRDHPDMPIIFLSARGTVADMVKGFNHGADDYMVKPFEMSELLARIHAVLRRHRRAERNLFGMVIKVGGASLNMGQLEYSAPCRPAVLLTPTEMKILECLMRNANIVISRETLIERIWGLDYDGETNRIEVYIWRLRTKIEDDPRHPTLIRTKRGFGYMFTPGHRSVERVA